MTDKPMIFKTSRQGHTSFWLYNVPENNCDICKHQIEEMNAVLITDFTKEGVFYNLMHINCVKKWVKHPLSVIQHRYVVLLTEVIPPGSIPVIFRNPSLAIRTSNISVFEPGKIVSDMTTDRTRYAPELDGDAPVVIGKPDVERLEALERPVEDVDSFLKDLQTDGKRAIEQADKGLLEDGKAKNAKAK